ncbi:MAG: DUF349 domain-containing protein, partial [Bacteroidaceae bacterium]|nr:DUF349 domain-containing protein [Bacteroidaceae bacterium]
MEEIKNIAPEEVKNENVQSQENAQAVETPETLTEMPTEVSEEAPAKAQPQTKEEIINRLKELVHEADKAERAELEQLKQTYYRLHNAEVVAAREAFIAAGGAAEEFQPEADTLEEEFKAQMSLVKEMRAKLAEEQEQIKQENLRKKQEIIERIKELGADPETADKGYEEVKTLQAAWKEIKLVPAEAATELWKTYHLHVEQFYDQLRLNHEFRAYDFKKNLEAKTHLCEAA